MVARHPSRPLSLQEEAVLSRVERLTVKLVLLCIHLTALFLIELLEARHKLTSQVERLQI